MMDVDTLPAFLADAADLVDELATYAARDLAGVDVAPPDEDADAPGEDEGAAAPRP